MSSRNTPQRRLAALLVLVLAGCNGAASGAGRTPTGGTTDTTMTDPTNPTTSTFIPTGAEAADAENAFRHPETLGGPETSPSEALARMEEQGPAAYAEHLHSCRKISYATVGRILSDLGVDMAATGETSAGYMYSVADQALGAPNYGARVPETNALTSSSASRLFDIFVQAAPEIIANLPSMDRCRLGGAMGVGTQMFDSSGSCTKDGISCLLGTPATDAHVEFCNHIVSTAATPTEGQQIAVASLLAAAYTCE